MDGLSINISAHAAWAPGQGEEAAWRSWTGHALPEDDGSAPEVRHIDALLRRRLGRLSRMALHVANQVAAKQPSLPTIFASRHGELNRTVAILHDLAADAPPSPTAFSLSVHNSAAGIFSIVRGDTSPSAALAAGDETLLWALLDAAVRLTANPAETFLLVYADEPFPPEYRAFSQPFESAHALALLLRSGEGLHLNWSENTTHECSPEPFALALMATLLGHRESLHWKSERLSVLGHA